MINVLLLLDPADPDAEHFRQALNTGVFADRVRLTAAAPARAAEPIREAEIVVCGSLNDDLIRAAGSLRWISFWSAGIDGKVTPLWRDRGLTVTSANGIHGPNIAEHVFAWMLMFARRMPEHLKAQIAGEWRRNVPPRASTAEELQGSTLGIIGLGRIGEAVMQRARAFGMRVVATKRDASEPVHSGDRPDLLVDRSSLDTLLQMSDHVLVSVPLTDETRHLIGARELALMKPTAYLYNVARGAVVDESALAAALRSGVIAGAGLDVFEQEPLPESSPLWGLENVLITPHVSGITPRYFERMAEQFAANLSRYMSGEPLENTFCSERGY